MSTFNANNIPSFSILDAIKTKPVPLDFVLGGILAGTVAGLVSPGGVGKSFLAYEAAAAIACGHDLTGALRIGRQGKVTYFNAEDSAEVLHHRIYAISKHLNTQQVESIIDNLTVCPLTAQYPYLIDSKGRVQQAVFDYFVKKAMGQRLVILDTLRRIHTADENENGDMAILIGALEGIAKESGAAILYLHHTNKSATLNGNGDTQGASRGASVLVDNARYIMNLTSMTKSESTDKKVPEIGKYVRLTDSKNNNTETEAGKWLYRAEGGVLVEATFTEHLTTGAPHGNNNVGTNHKSGKSDKSGISVKSIAGKPKRENEFRLPANYF